MKNFVANGGRLTITAGANITSGSGVLVGSLFGVAETDIANGAQGALVLEGIFDLPKAPSQAWIVGQLIYWDAPNNRCTSVAGTLKLIGAAVAAVGAGSGETIGRVRLNAGVVN
jgi:predicted RecA/RadA family phage recombinase